MQNSQDMNIKNKIQRKKQKKKRKKYCRCNFLWKKENSGLYNFYCDLLSPKEIVKRSQFMYHNHIISSSTNICNILWVILIISAKYNIILKTRLNRNAVAMKKKKKSKNLAIKIQFWNPQTCFKFKGTDSKIQWKLINLNWLSLLKFKVVPCSLVLQQQNIKLY